VAPKGSFVALLGPSGCGKTTLLRSIAGLVEPTSGQIVINGLPVNDIPIYRRNIGMVFQNYALFPHKTVGDNIAFGLKYKGVPKSERKKKVQEALELVRLPHVAQRYPSELSGGQQQRIAIARAIITEPDVLLLDEPLSALDANLRADMRAEIRYLQKKTGITTVFVTHDQEEALSLADLVVVMRQGEIVQSGTPEEVYSRPSSRFVAEFLGNANIIPGRVTELDKSGMTLDLAGIVCRVPKMATTVNQDVFAVIRTNRVEIEPVRGSDLDGDGIVAERVFFGDKISYTVEARAVRITVVRSSEKPLIDIGARLNITLDSADLSLLDSEGNRIKSSAEA
jgi:ABC-type Fe3+/spermidine/putrescine transport system ATPase subunit